MHDMMQVHMSSMFY